ERLFIAARSRFYVVSLDGTVLREASAKDLFAPIGVYRLSDTPLVAVHAQSADGDFNIELLDDTCNTVKRLTVPFNRIRQLTSNEEARSLCMCGLKMDMPLSFPGHTACCALDLETHTTAWLGASAVAYASGELLWLQNGQLCRG